MSASALQRALTRQDHFSPIMPQGISKKELFDDADLFISKVGKTNLDIWFFGVDQLPVHEYESVESIWIKNLNGGCNYHLIWFIDQINNKNFNQYSRKIESIGKKISKSKVAGKISNYSLILLPQYNLDKTSNIEDYNRLCNSKNNSCEWNPIFLEDSENLKNIKCEIIKYWQCTSSIILYSTRAKAREIPSKAALHLKNFYLDLDESEVVSPFLWYASEHVNRIEEIVVAIQNLKTD